MNDALGNPIKIGYEYGYTTSSNGITNVNTGVASKITEMGVTLLIHSCNRYYAGKKWDQGFNKKKMASGVRSFILFPIKDYIA